MKIKVKNIIYLFTFIGFTILGVFSLNKKEEIYLNDAISYDSGEEAEEHIFVHIEGAILNPGIKKVKKGTRIFELINISGGELEEADLSRINLASILKDEQKVIIPYKIVQVDTIGDYVENEVKNSSNSLESIRIININYANQEELESLEGIGPAMAQKIISYRNEEGLFNSIEDIKNVSGIGESKYNKIKERISV